MDKQGEIAILYSGGTDSTCVAAVLAERFKVLHLLTFERLGFFSIENSYTNVAMLKEKFPSNIFIHKIINIDYLAKSIMYSNFIKYLFKYGFFILSNCIYCGLIHHIGALIYCLDNSITDVADGATREWLFFPTHMDKVILEFRKMYANFSIKYYTPVYDFELVSPFRLTDKISSIKTFPKKVDSSNIHKNTTGNYLFKLGIIPMPNIKGTDLDHQMQPRCFQFILHHLYLYWYFMLLHDYSRFESITLKFLREKMDYHSKLIKKNRRDEKVSVF